MCPENGQSRQLLRRLSGNFTLSERAYVGIKEAILTLELKPGATLVEEELARTLGTSATPVRDALKRLQRDGLVQQGPYRTTTVTKVTLQDEREIVELREVVEGLLGRLVVSRITTEELDEAEAMLVAYDEAIENHDLRKATELSENFHSVLLAHCPNGRLREQLGALGDQMRRLLLIYDVGMERMRQSSSEHWAILRALRCRNPEEVEAAIRTHHRTFLNDLSNRE